MLDRKPRRTIGIPRPPRLSKPPWRWRAEDMAWGAAEMIAVALLWLVLALVQLACLAAIVWAVVEWGIPWVVDVVMSAVEQRD